MTQKISLNFSYKRKNMFLIFLFFLGCSLSFHHCTSDTSEKSNMTAGTVEEEQKALIVEAIVGTNKIVIDPTAISTASRPENVEIQKERAQFIKQSLDTSSVVKEFGQDCSAILAKYTKVVNKFAESGDERVLDEILVWQNDPMFIHCSTQEPHKALFQKLNEILE